MGSLRKVFPKVPISQGKSEGKVYYDWSANDHHSNNQLSICIQNCVFSLQVEGTQPSAGWSTCLCTLSCTSTISWPPLESGMTVDQPSTGSSLKKNSVQSSTGSPLISLFFCNFYIFDIFRHKKTLTYFHILTASGGVEKGEKSLSYTRCNCCT